MAAICRALIRAIECSLGPRYFLPIHECRSKPSGLGFSNRCAIICRTSAAMPGFVTRAHASPLLLSNFPLHVGASNAGASKGKLVSPLEVVCDQ